MSFLEPDRLAAGPDAPMLLADLAEPGPVEVREGPEGRLDGFLEKFTSVLATACAPHPLTHWKWADGIYRTILSPSAPTCGAILKSPDLPL
ncbi:MAG TPA: hypothetical protein VMU77_01490, partial [Acidimicrobiales bacterium]|nr:hypothetical protein [Acidimicrobiales bacterium]